MKTTSNIKKTSNMQITSNKKMTSNMKMTSNKQNLSKDTKPIKPKNVPNQNLLKKIFIAKPTIS